MMKSINPLKRFQKGSILVHILYHADKEPIYGAWIKEELVKHGYNLSDGTLYPWLKRLTYSGLLSSEKRNVKGKVRKYYYITELGKKHFQEIQKHLRKLYNEVIVGE
ncbi:MAG: PadR family transcriptional regulator [Promethearchaeota archaeon]